MKKDRNKLNSTQVAQVNGKISTLKKKKHWKKKKKSEKQTTNEKETKQTVNDNNTTVVKCNKLNVKSQPVITKDSKHIICPCGNVVAIFRRKTGFLEHYFTQHKYDVTNVYINNRDPSQVISCSSREILVWEYADVTLVKRYDVPFAALQWHINPRCYEDVYYKRERGEKGSSSKTELIKWNVNGTSKPEVLGNVSKGEKCVAVSNNGEHVIYSYKNKLLVYPCDDDAEPLTFDVAYITCVALHPTEFIACTGDKKGRNVIWYNLQQGGGKQICVKLHWHHHPVVDMVFSNDGHYLMSGGRESVLVIWQLETQKKSFIPRVGGTIRHLTQSSDSQFICLSLHNNMLKIISATTSKLTRTIKYLSQAYELPAGLTYHAPTDCLVLNGIPDGVVQFYQPKNDVVKLSVDLVGENPVSDVVKRYVYPTRVLLVAFSDDGTWMATIDERQDRILPTDRKLKFWKYSEEKKNYSLSTLVDPPHKGEVYSLCFRPLMEPHDRDYTVVTTSEDGEVKTWVVAAETEDDVESWQIHSVGSYGSKSCRQACFSHDGNFLAVLFCAVTLWDPETLTLQRCLEFNVKNDCVKDISFACNESSDYLIGRSSNFLIVWNVKECCIVWMLQVNVCLLVCDRYSRYCAAFIKPTHGEQTTDLYLFDPVSPSPKSLLRNVLNNKDAVVSSALFTRKEAGSDRGESVWAETGQLYILTESTEIYAVKEKVDEKEKNKDKNVDMADDDEKSAFEDIFGSISNDKLTDDRDDVEDDDKTAGQLVGNPSATFIRKMMSTPSNVLPAADVLCKAYIKSLLLPKPPEANEECDAMETEPYTKEDIAENKTVVVDSRDESITNSDVNNIEAYAPSKGLLKKLKRLNFDFVEPFT